MSQPRGLRQPGFSGLASETAEAETGSVVQEAEKILVESADAFEKGVGEFLATKGSTLSNPDDRPRRYWDRAGGTALGNHEQRARIADNPELLRAAVADRLRNILDRSAGPREKARASSLNAAEVQAGFWQLGDLVHQSSAWNLEGILKEGLLCSEVRGDGSKVDVTPLQADFSEVVDRLEVVNGPAEHYQRKYTSMYDGASGAVLLRFRREVGSTDYGEEGKAGYDASPCHRTIFVGLPSTELAGIQVVGERVDVEQIIQTVESSGQYIPIFDKDGELVFTSAEFELVTGIEIASPDAVQAAPPDLERTKSQVVRMAHRLLGLAPSGGYGSYVWRSYDSREPFSHAVDMAEGRMHFNHGQGHDRVSIPLDNNRVLHILEKQGGQLDVFLSQLDAEARHITEADLPALRGELAKEFAAARSRLVVGRAETLRQEQEWAEEESIL